jgi:hypothetical protein
MVSAEPSLSSHLRRIRRRIRGWRALEGGFAGLAVGCAAGAAWIAAGHLRGAPVAIAGLLLFVAACALIGVAVRAARRIALDHCARVADRALDGQDRVLSALHLSDRDGPLARALVADALARLATLAPEVAFPSRRPKALPLAVASALALALAAVTPVRSRAARPMPAPLAAPVAKRPLVVAAEVDAELAAARNAAELASRLDDARLGELARDLERLLAGLQTGTLDAGDALDKMKAIEAAAASDARAAALDERARDAALEALSKQAATRAVAQALRANSEGATDAASAAMAAAAETRPAETGRALAGAAQAVASSANGAGDDKAGEPGRRRLARDRPNNEANTNPGARGDDARRLERLSRDLDDAAARCRAGDPSCRNDAEARGRDLSQLSRRAAAGEGMRQLERAARQLRARMGQGELSEGGDDAAARRFQRAARGEGDGEREQSGESGGASDRVTGVAMEESGSDPTGSEGPSGPSGQPNRQGQQGEGGNADMAGMRAGGGGSEERSGSGEGIGRQPGSEAAGERTTLGARGRDAEARVADGAGPNRAQVIGSAGGRGFAAEGYARVYADYSAAVEDALGTTAVPEGKRFLVRRYFDLIRPRPLVRGGGR